MIPTDLPLLAQDQKDPYKDVTEAIHHKKFQKAFDRLQEKEGVAKGSPDHLALKAYLIGRLGEKKPDRDQQRKEYSRGVALAERALNKDPDHAFAHFAKALNLGLLVKKAPPSEKIKYARTIKKEAEKALELDSSLAGAHHILGRWHKKLATLSSIERWSIGFFYGGLPEASFEKAYGHFKKAAALGTDKGIHYYEMGLTLQKMERSEQAKEKIEKARRFAKSMGDQGLIRKCNAFLEEHQDE